MYNIKSNCVKPFAIALLSVLMTACGSGGGSSGDISTDGGGSGGSNNPTNTAIKTVYTISSEFNTTYIPTCLYKSGNNIVLVNGDDSGTGLSFDTTTGSVSNVTGIAKIDLINGDECLPNLGQLTWINKSNPTTINIFDPNVSATKVVDLSQAGVGGSNIYSTSFDWDSNSNNLYANNTFLNNTYFGISVFNLNPPITSYSNLDNSSYLRSGIPVLYGFWGFGSSFVQLYPANNDLPAVLLTGVLGGHGNPVQQTVATITDSNNQPISKMSAAWDIASVGGNLIITAGAVQPVLYRCSRSSVSNITCNKTYTINDLTGNYRIVRLLGGTNNTLYFMGINLARGSAEILSMNL